jgi:hypothetical protein
MTLDHRLYQAQRRRASEHSLAYRMQRRREGYLKRPVPLFKELANASSFHALTPVTVLLN